MSTKVYVPQSDRLALRSCRVFETYDLDCARENISRIMQPHVLDSGGLYGRSRAHMDFLRMPGIGIGTIAFGAAEISVPPLEDYYLIILCLSGSAVISTGRRQQGIDSDNGVACMPGDAIIGRFSPSCEQLVIKIDRRRMLTFTGGSDIALAHRVDVRSLRLAPFWCALRGLMGDPVTVTLIQENREVANEYEQLLLRLLLIGHDHSSLVRQEPGKVRPAALRRAIAYLYANLRNPVGVADIGAAAGVPERTLQDIFQKFEGVSPSRYLRNIRLDKARDRLVESGCGESISEVALDSGFTHFGRFAKDYAERFGERPSDTVRRCAKGG